MGEMVREGALTPAACMGQAQGGYTWRDRLLHVASPQTLIGVRLRVGVFRSSLEVPRLEGNHHPLEVLVVCVTCGGERAGALWYLYPE